MLGIDYVLAPVLIVLLFLGVLWGKYLLRQEEDTIKVKLKEKENRRKENLKTLEKMNEEKIYLKEKLAGLSKLYAITKNMSFDVRFDELFNTLKNFLVDNFQFKKFTIVLFKYENGTRTIDKSYQIDHELCKEIKLEQSLSGVADSLAESKDIRFLEKENILSFSLIMHGRINSVIFIEDLPKDERDKFFILGAQIVLQVERISLFDNIEKLSVMDGLTGAFLKRYFLKKLNDELSRAGQAHMELSFIMVDLDHFKQCNDNFGHLVGDVVLKEVANILKNNIREIDLLGRFGGEEFCILLPETDKAGAYTVGERIRKAVEDFNIKAYDESIRTTLSMGISSFPEDSSSLDDLVEAADKALYKAKEEGRNRVCLA